VSGDARLQRLLTQGFLCSSCKERHVGVFDVAYSCPVYWTQSEDRQPDEAVQAALAEGRDILTKNFCLEGEHYYVRCIIPFNIQGSEETFAFGVWGSLSAASFRKYLDDFFAPSPTPMDPAFSWLSNQLPGSDDRPYKCRLHPQKGDKRPVLEIGEEDHPFYAAQLEGLTVDKLLEIYASTGHALGDLLT
jgi:hypothetical protein